MSNPLETDHRAVSAFVTGWANMHGIDKRLKGKLVRPSEETFSDKEECACVGNSLSRNKILPTDDQFSPFPETHNDLKGP